MKLSAKFSEAIIDGLNRKTLSVPHIWAEKCRVMTGSFPGPTSFKHYPWQVAMLDSDHPDIVGQKAAQMGYTDTLLNRAFYTIDQLGRDVLYVLPNQNPDAGDFSQSRFDPALEASEHLSSMFTDVNKIGLKRSGNTCLYIRGSRSDSQLKSIPVSLVILDEVDEMSERAIALVKERMSGQLHKQMWQISTPTIAGRGINASFTMSTQEHFMFPCPCCSRTIELSFPDCLQITGDDKNDPNILNSYYKCPTCSGKIKHEDKSKIFEKAFWQAMYENRLIKGFYINQMYSPTITAGEFAQAFLASEDSVHKEQEFYNSKLGIPHVPKGAQITELMLKQCYGTHVSSATNNGKVKTMGIDVGKKCHYVVKEWDLAGFATTDVNDNAKAKIVSFGTIPKKDDGAGFHEIDPVIREHEPYGIVIDALPENRSSRSLCSRYPGIANMCIYNHNVKGKSLQHHEEEQKIVANRTYWLDTTLGRYKNKTVSLPADVDREFLEHMQSLVRRYDTNSNGEEVGKYINNNYEDHYAHADNYAEIALAVAFEDGVVKGSTDSPL